MPKPLRSKPVRKLGKPAKNPQRWRELQQRATSLSSRDGERGRFAAMPHS